MVEEQPPLVLRPLHVWFQFWEDVIPSLYRVIAVAVAAIVTAVLMGLITSVHWLLALVLATAGWIVLAIIQEHDERVVLDVDSEFLGQLRTQVEPVLARAGFAFRTASGPTRARRDRSDTFLFEADGDGDCIDLWIHRSRSAGGALEVLVDGRSLDRVLGSFGESQLGDRVSRVVDAASDAAALLAAFELLDHNGYLRRLG